MKTKFIFHAVAGLMLLAGPNRAAAVTRTWSGLGGNPSWSTPGNWVGSVIPQATNDLDFPGGAAQFATQNNYLGAAHSITFGVGGYSIVGASMVLSNGVNSTNTTGANVLAHPVTLGANQGFTNLNPGTSLILTVLDLAGHGATFRGAGTNQVASPILDSIGGGGLTNAGTGIFLLSGSNSFTGPTLLSSGTNIINGFHRRSPITWTGGTLAGTGHLGQVTASGATAKQLTPGFGGTGILEASNLVLSSSVTLAMQINGTNVGTDYDRLVVSNGNLSIGSAALSLSFLASLSSEFGTTFTLINLPNAANTISGTFNGLPEGSTFTNSQVIYQLSYAGGDGNDVTLTTSGYVSTGTTRVWSGAGTNNLWMNRTNWIGNNAPVQGDTLRFENGAGFLRLTNINDFPADTTFGALRFDAPLNSTLNYTLIGNRLRLNDGVRVDPTAGANLAINGTITVSNLLALNNSQTFTNSLDGEIHFAGGVALEGNTLSVGVRGNTDLFFDAPVTGPGRFDANAGGRVSLTSSNEITGVLDISQGLVLALHPQALGSAAAGPVHIGTNGVLRLQAANAVFTGSAIVLTGRLDVAASPTSGLAAPLIVAGSNAELRVINTLSSFTNFTLLGFVTNGLQLLNSGGGGFVRLAPAASIQGGGVLRNLGTLDVDGTAHNVVVLGNNSLGGNLSGAGQIDTLISTNFGSIAPGSASDATLAFDPLRVGTLVLGNVTTVQLDLFPNRPGGGSTNNSLITTNAPTLGNANLKLNAVTNLTPNQQFTILRNDSALPVTNTFKNLPEGSLCAATNGNFALRISYLGGGGNDVVLTVLSNTPPAFAAVTTNLTITESNTLTYTNVITDIERPPQTFTWTLLTPFSGLTLNPTNGVLTWATTEAQGPSTNTVLVQVTDSGTPPMSSTGTVVVTILEFNQAPVPVAVPVTNVLAGNTVTIQLAATDADIPVNPLTWEPVSLLAGASVTANGLFTYTPGLLEAGLKTNRVRVFDFSTDAVNQKSLTNNLSIVVSVLMRRIVTNTSDSGPGSLRQAFIEVNTNASGGQVEFNIPGPGPHKIAPLTQLPGLSRITVVDGYTQPNSQPNTLSIGDNAVLMVEVSGENIPGNTGIFWGGFGSGQGSTIRGLCINRFTNGTALTSGCASCGGAATGGSVVEGCFIGTDITGAVAFPNSFGIQYLNTFNARIGGPDPSQRNIISGNLFYGIQPSQGFDGAFLINITIQNNYIGTDHTGTNALGNRFGGINAPVGGVGGQGFSAKNCLLADNVISANGGAVAGPGVNWGGPTNRFLRNKIGIGADGIAPLGNGGSGFEIFTTDSTIGGTNLADANLIANNGRAGVSITGGTRNAVLGNSFFGNNGLAIDLGGVGRTGNDLGDGDSSPNEGPNDLQNFPVVTTAAPVTGSVTISGSLNSLGNTIYRIELFHSPTFSPANQPQAALFLAWTNVTTDGSGNASFSITITNTLSGGFLTATATDPGGSTSEISDGLPFARLEIRQAGSQVRVLWLTNLTTFVLQSNANLAQPNAWSDVSGSSGVAGANFFRDFPPNPSPLFFRLRSP